MAFHFRRFEVEDERSTMRVGTDAMLLGAWATPGRAQRILDIGTGSGVLALMMAQKTTASIDAIDIDLPSVAEASGNFERSSWSDRLSAIHRSLQEHSPTFRGNYDYIVVNPPYFTKSMHSPSDRKNIARHEGRLTAEELAGCAAELLAPAGVFAVILPAGRSDGFKAICANQGLLPERSLAVTPKPGAAPLRILTEFSRLNVSRDVSSTLCIRDERGAFSPEYLALTANFHNF
jgi:tRNA1Val (adenine37-N6)-methyltransferase